MPIKLCNPASQPVLGCTKTRLYGVPRGTAGRDNVPILAIALHCIPMEYEAYNQQACSSSPNNVGCDHASMHFVIDGNIGRAECMVDPENVAWAFQTYPSNFSLPHANTPYPGWTELAGLFPLYSADFYTLNIGITVPKRPETEIIDGEDCCLGPYGMTWDAYDKLVRLIAWLAEKYGIPIDNQHIAFHDQIVEVAMGCEECLCRNLTCFLCDVSGYCETCSNAGDPTFTTFDNIDYIYGEYRGCRVKISIEDLKELLNA